MLTVEEYISQMKKKDGIDEFDWKNHAENMAAVIKYVMDYFNTYLNPDDYDYELIKAEQTAAKILQEINAAYPQSKEFITEYFKKYKKRIDRSLSAWLTKSKYFDLYCFPEDFEEAITRFGESPQMKGTDILQFKDQLFVLAQEIKADKTDFPSASGWKLLDNNLMTWVKNTFNDYGVNLLHFASERAESYFEHYVDIVRDHSEQCTYYINRYNHRYNDNPFDIDEVYQNNAHRPFINGRKGELEMLIMYSWIFNWMNDPEYWPEYVNLCVSTGRVEIARNMNILLPVRRNGIDYPADVISPLSYVETVDGTIKDDPGPNYVLKLQYVKENDTIWKNETEIRQVAKNLNEAFAVYNPPLYIEILSPLKSDTYQMEDFFKIYRLFEKLIKKRAHIQIAVLNGYQRSSSKPKYLIQTVDDMVVFRRMVREMKYKLRLAVDISKLINRKSSRYYFETDFNKLTDIRNSIIGLHLSVTSGTSSIRQIHFGDTQYLNKYSYHENSDLMGCLSALCNDNLPRYFVPEDPKSETQLEELVDDLIRAGFSFGKGIHHGAL